jgi:hypothetical protein
MQRFQDVTSQSPTHSRARWPELRIPREHLQPVCECFFPAGLSVCLNACAAGRASGRCLRCWRKPAASGACCHRRSSTTSSSGGHSLCSECEVLREDFFRAIGVHGIAEFAVAPYYAVTIVHMDPVFRPYIASYSGHDTHCGARLGISAVHLSTSCSLFPCALTDVLDWRTALSAWSVYVGPCTSWFY